ncbi:hypothetical protein [Streptomyces sp. NPDC051310]|uniref:hypothetical protein n=1 Tax=Streptomyces sp. NPDC051310 TaxID=3365649 RepID=UPI0037B58D13
MRSRLLALRAAGAAALPAVVPAAVLAPVLVLAPAAGPAHAGEEDPGSHHARVTAMVLPAVVQPGGDVDIRVSGCKRDHGHVRSKAFVTDAELSALDGHGRPLHGDTTVKSHLTPGTYDITVHCDGRDHRDAGLVHVLHHTPPTPVAPVRAGGGGTAALTADPAPAPGPADAPSVADGITGAGEAGPGTPHTVIGLVLAGVAAVAVAFRSARLRRHRRTDAGHGAD